MPKVAPTDQEQANRIVRACISNNQELYGVDIKQLSIKTRCTERCFRGRMSNPGDFDLSELRAIAKTLKLTPIQCASIVMGRALTSKEVKEFLML